METQTTASEQADAIQRLAQMQLSKGDIAQQAMQEERKISPISASEMRGDLVPLRIKGLQLMLKPLTRKKVREFVALVSEWPDVLQFAAAVKNPKNSAVDFEQTALIMTVYELSLYSALSDEEKAKIPEPVVSSEDVGSRLAGLVDTMGRYDPVICETVGLFLAHDETMTPEVIQDLLEEHLLIPDYASLLRGLKLACGTFSGSVTERFTQPSPDSENAPS